MARKYDDPILDATPLLDWLEEHPRALEGWSHHWIAGDNEHAGALRNISRYRSLPLISFSVMDHICCLLGVHPTEVFGDVYWEAPI